jgi:serine/threonine-protein kinase
MTDISTRLERPARTPQGSGLRDRPGQTVVETSDPLASAVPRVRKLAMVLVAIGVIWAGVLLFVDLGAIEMPFQPHRALAYGTVGAVVVAGIAMIAITYRPWPYERILDKAIAFELLGALAISLTHHSMPRTGGVSFVCVWILAFTMVPVTPARAALGAFGAAATGPLAVLIHAAMDTHGEVTAYAFVGTLSNFIAATIAVISNRVVYGLGASVRDARKLGAYHLIEPLGEGGMGEVWRAEHQALIRPAAVKLLRHELASLLGPHELEAMNLRFHREVQATALLTSPHTVAIYDFGQTGDGTLYYVMELLNGLDAESLVRKHGPQPAERVAHVMRQACDSLAEAHARDLVHRDIKPANLFLCAVGVEVDFVKVLDFGLVKDVQSDLRLTGEGAVSGTPAYLAPEGAAHNQYDARGDIYALACTAYFLLTGKLVFDGETPAAVMAAHIRDKPKLPSKRTELAIPKDLEALIMACLEKDPAKRPQSASDLAARLDAIQLATPWTQTRAQAWWRTHLPDHFGKARTTCVTECVAARNRPTPVVRNRAAG